MGASQVDIKPVVPAPTSILGKTITSGTAVNLITIPAGRTWYGTLGVESTGAAGNSASILIIGSTATPAAGTLLQCDAVANSANSNHMHGAYISAGSSSASLSGTVVGTGSVSVNGILL